MNTLVKIANATPTISSMCVSASARVRFDSCALERVRSRSSLDERIRSPIVAAPRAPTHRVTTREKFVDGDLAEARDAERHARHDAAVAERAVEDRGVVVAKRVREVFPRAEFRAQKMERIAHARLLGEREVERRKWTATHGTTM